MQVFLLSERISKKCALIITTKDYFIVPEVANQYPIVCVEKDNAIEFIQQFVKSYKTLSGNIIFFMPNHHKFALTLIATLQCLLEKKLPENQLLAVQPADIDPLLLEAWKKAFPQLATLKFRLKKKRHGIFGYWHIMLLVSLLLINIFTSGLSPILIIGIGIVVLGIWSAASRWQKTR
jgi:hypothetical protein